MMQLRVRAARAARLPVVGSMLLCVAVLIGAFALPQSASATEGFDFPVGYPDGTGWNRGFCSNVKNPNCDNNPCVGDALDFLEWHDYGEDTDCIRHPGEDWNKDCGGNCDCGEDVHVIADGVVMSVSDDCSWGATIIRHDNVPGYGTLWSVYGHMEHSIFAAGSPVRRGDIIGLVAMKGATFCHLHLEIRTSDLGACFFPNEKGQGSDPRAWVEARYLNPTAFIASHRPLAQQPFVIQPGPEGKDTFYGTAFVQDGGPDSPILYNGGWGDAYYDYIEFDLAGSPNASETAACVLHLYASAAPFDPGLQIDRITQSWSEASVTQTNNPASAFYAPFGPVLPPSGWKTVDITQLYKDWKSGVYPNYGIKLSPTATDHTNGSFYSSDNPDPTRRPKLVITTCSADFNGDGSINSQDFFDFLAAFFSLQPAADFNHDAFINSQDFFDFLAAFFIGC